MFVNETPGHLHFGGVRDTFMWYGTLMNFLDIKNLIICNNIDLTTGKKVYTRVHLFHKRVFNSILHLLILKYWNQQVFCLSWLQWYFLNSCIHIHVSLKFFPGGLIENNSALIWVFILTWTAPSKKLRGNQILMRNDNDFNSNFLFKVEKHNKMLITISSHSLLNALKHLELSWWRWTALRCSNLENHESQNKNSVRSIFGHYAKLYMLMALESTSLLITQIILTGVKCCFCLTR